MDEKYAFLRNVDMGSHVPKAIYQTYNRKLMTPKIRSNIEQMLEINPGYTYRGFNDEEAEGFIREEFGADVLSRYLNLNPSYGAAKADLFRYLLIYRCGGIYLDIKSTIVEPLDSMLLPDDAFILSQWDNSEGRPFAGYGFHKELSMLPGGEFQQWFIISVAGHPFLRAVIEEVLGRIDRYRPWRDAVGRLGVVRTTGPIPYTKAILEVLNQYPYRRVVYESCVGVKYTINEMATAHVNGAHYWFKRSSITRGHGFQRPLFKIFALYMFFARSHKINKLTLGLLPVNRDM